MEHGSILGPERAVRSVRVDAWRALCGRHLVEHRPQSRAYIGMAYIVMALRTPLGRAPSVEPPSIYIALDIHRPLYTSPYIYIALYTICSVRVDTWSVRTPLGRAPSPEPCLHSYGLYSYGLYDRGLCSYGSADATWSSTTHVDTHVDTHRTVGIERLVNVVDCVLSAMTTSGP